MFKAQLQENLKNCILAEAAAEVVHMIEQELIPCHFGQALLIATHLSEWGDSASALQPRASVGSKVKTCFDPLVAILHM